MRITVVEVSGLAHSVVSSGLAMCADYDPVEFRSEVASLQARLDTVGVYSSGVVNNRHFQRACKLGKMPSNSGHCSFLKGITVTANFSATVKWWEQFQRYHFKEIVTSMSTMHRIRQMIESQSIEFDAKTSQQVIDAFLKVAPSLKDDELAYSCPMGLVLTAAVSTNYLQLKTIWEQRHVHKLAEWWKDFCPWIARLPHFKELTGIMEEKDGKDFV